MGKKPQRGSPRPLVENGPGATQPPGAAIRKRELGRAPGAKLSQKEKLAQGYTWMPCLKCTDDFLSAGKGNHLCPECRAENAVEHIRQIFGGPSSEGSGSDPGGTGIWRVLRRDGACWLNMGDCYASDTKWGGSTGGKHAAGLHGQTGVGRQKTHTGLKPKDLLGMPWRVAFAVQADGWWLRAAIVWAKGLSFCDSYSGSVMPESCRDRPTSAYEMVFLLTRSARYFYDSFAAREVGTYPAGSAKGQRVFGGANKQGANLAHARTTGGTWDQNSGMRNWRNVWVLGPESCKEAHFAAFPTALPEKCIVAGSSPFACGDCGAPYERITSADDADDWKRACGGDKDGTYAGQATKDYAGAGAQNASDVKRNVLAGMKAERTTGWRTTCGHVCRVPGRSLVLDPFAGTARTGIAAKRLGRDFIGIELSPAYIALARRNLQKATTEPLFK
jgi:hypothetical protein